MALSRSFTMSARGTVFPKIFFEFPTKPSSSLHLPYSPGLMFFLVKIKNEFIRVKQIKYKKRCGDLFCDEEGCLQICISQVTIFAI